jgi:hypothetical protein
LNNSSVDAIENELKEKNYWPVNYDWTGKKQILDMDALVSVPFNSYVSYFHL